MKAIILSGGLGSRLKPFTEVIPKPLLPIGEKAILEIQIENLKKHGFEEIILATNYKSNYIENFFGDGSKYGVKLKISQEEIALGTAGPVKLLENELDKPFLVMNGDILTLLNYQKMYDFALQSPSILTLGIKDIITPFRFGNIFTEGDYVVGIEEKPNIETTILAGVYIFKPEILKYIPNNTYYGMDTLIKDLLANQIKIAKYQIKEYWIDIGQIEDYEKAQEVYNNHFRQEI
ncbi:MAG: sugar phosphate nucleotidyltransferase [Candidatus Cloacimonadales bacterium]|jgi:NDP-sugar pyrophosphorylase family protein|nr:NTP transferase domain-containing protein [Candidatus Cloacimonadota bacterium]MDD2650849.1 sugar phosphate nucleotidyltransferase [Candidatus Cloacimonadota bacterium]MDD3501409.1 sugar phosphate nucleotidyltransferase [Candidatus Cloacimonadota bacterium]MDX9977964.1 sugar phosphate nucleotidyltransferase [Candidatus Cloacimonadales bacterium]